MEIKIYIFNKPMRYRIYKRLCITLKASIA